MVLRLGLYTARLELFLKVKPLLEINPDSAVIRKIEESGDDEFVKALSSVILDQALLAEGVMPSDSADFVRNLTRILSV